jgi:hypothetical protein
MRFLAIFVAATLAGAAFADFSSIAPSQPGPAGATLRADEYMLDDGSSENSIGLTAGGTFGFINHFAVQAGLEQLTGVSTAWGTPLFPGDSGVTPGQSFGVYVWVDDNGDSDPTNGSGASLVAVAFGEVSAASIDSDVLQTVPVAFDLTGYSNFYVGVEITHAAATFPAPLDQTASAGQSWVALGDPFPGNLLGALNMDGIGLPGNWLVRANAIPEPAGLALLALGLLLRRR